VEILLSQRTKRNAMQKIRALTPRPWDARLTAAFSRSTRGPTV
jgi:hypothetical protein